MYDPIPNVDDGRWQVSIDLGFKPAWSRSTRGVHDAI